MLENSVDVCDDHSDAETVTNDGQPSYNAATYDIRSVVSNYTRVWESDSSSSGAESECNVYEASPVEEVLDDFSSSSEAVPEERITRDGGRTLCKPSNDALDDAEADISFERAESGAPDAYVHMTAHSSYSEIPSSSCDSKSIRSCSPDIMLLCVIISTPVHTQLNLMMSFHWFCFQTYIDFFQETLIPYIWFFHDAFVIIQLL